MFSKKRIKFYKQQTKFLPSIYSPRQIGRMVWQHIDYSSNNSVYAHEDHYHSENEIYVYIKKGEDEELLIKGWCLMEGIPSVLEDYKWSSFGINDVPLDLRRFSDNKREEFISFLKAHKIKGTYL